MVTLDKLLCCTQRTTVRRQPSFRSFHIRTLRLIIDPGVNQRPIGKDFAPTQRGPPVDVLGSMKGHGNVRKDHGDSLLIRVTH
jgi:hypothetical protein